MTQTSSDEAEQRKATVAAVFDRGATDYDRIGEFFTPIARDLVGAAGVTIGDRVLDLGCGRGALLFAAAAAAGPAGRVTGIDLAPQMVALTAAEARARGLTNVEVSVGDAERPQFAAGSFDAVLASLVLFFLPDPMSALRRYAVLLAPGGRLGFTTFAGNDPNFEAGMRALGAYIAQPHPPRDERQGPFGSRERITELLEAAGYESPAFSERSYETRFADPDEWLRWVWSHGGRATIEQVPPERLDEASDAAKRAFAGARTEAGDYAIRTAIRCTVSRPAG
jgi:ubiquinone/menaquinone biosynthesis C-methylase UbiE